MDFKNIEEFWPFYMKQHSKPLTRKLHFISTILSVPILIYAILFDWRFLFVVPFTSYGVAWYSHFYVEKNKPATFEYPLWSLMCDFRMFGLMLTGQMNKELIRLRKRQA